MIKIFTTLSFFLLGMLAQAQTTATRTVSEFSKIEVSDNIELIYTETTAPSITVSAMNNEKATKVNTDIKDGILSITMKNQSDNGTYRVYVTGNGLNSIVASNAQVTVTNQLSAYELNLVLENGATFNGNIRSTKKLSLRTEENTTFHGLVATETFEAFFNSNAKASITGNAEFATINAYNRSVCLAGNFAAKSVRINADDDATVKVHAKNELDITVAEKARVTYTGKPKTVKMNENAIAFNSLSIGDVVAAK